jgi:hypothetical protein
MSDFQRRHYIKVADLLKEIHSFHDWDSTIFETLVVDFGDMFRADNPNFDYDRFYDHVGINITN